MALPVFLTKLNDRVFGAQAVRDARGALTVRDPAQARALAQARLLLEAARRVAEPVEALPAGARPAVLIALYRDAAYWALQAGRGDGVDAPADLSALWSSVPPETLAKGAPEIALPAIRNTLVERSLPASLEATDEDAARAREFVEALIADLEAPRMRLDRAIARRWLRLAGLVVVVVALGYGSQQLLRGPNLAEGKPFRTSSSWVGCAADPPCAALMFHTDDQENPWVEIDLGAAKTIRRIEVANRTDCCSERAVPLIAEISADRVSWKQVGRRDKEFSSWTVKFAPQTARYVKLSVPKRTVLHFREVAVR
jgi:hypothetical protein